MKIELKVCAICYLGGEGVVTPVQDTPPLNFSYSYDEETGEFSVTFAPIKQVDKSQLGDRSMAMCQKHGDNFGGLFETFRQKVAALELLASKQDGDYVEPEQDDEADEYDQADEGTDPLAAVADLVNEPEPQPEPEPEPKPEPVRTNLRKRRNRSSETTEIRAWGKANGWDVADRGALPIDLVERYKAAHDL
ncbi:Lsr2 family DNA-binding protein [Nonomuraea recticatena]|uniref:Lsr2 DNA-binding domain-containing protein n=1 Tax=Nonomuraea recticatena TaxID=46178 RepID=A0ABN3S0M5_9ACTN